MDLRILVCFSMRPASHNVQIRKKMKKSNRITPENSNNIFSIFLIPPFFGENKVSSSLAINQYKNGKDGLQLLSRPMMLLFKVSLLTVSDSQY